ncbi:membrane fusion protein, adhesin transport system [Desulfovibrio litoralis DSM 11393]|uniref:Membrane fusion protein, adhesin transport system n=2 Tax=Desulfovibrio litoralis TaxID=466107 RepID=A0A1M7T453_9BACT|nr:membrane fusion protein, adhesin transport system [Desulfovibrio litoralis DSM 11393]
MSEVDAALNRKAHPLTYIISVSILIFFIVLIFWAGHAPIDQMTRGMGTVVPSQRVEEIKNPDTSMLNIQSVNVKENQIVAPGDVLVVLSNEQAKSVVEDALNKKAEHTAALIRLEAEYNDTEPVFPQELIDVNPVLVQDQKALFFSRNADREAEESRLNAQLDQKKQEVQSAMELKKQNEDSLANALQRRNIAAPLVAKGTFPRLQFLDIEQQVNSLRSEVERAAGQIISAQRGVAEVEAQIDQVTTRLNSQIQEEIAKRRSELNSITQMLVASQDRASRTTLTATKRATVKRILLNSGPVQGGQAILELLPLDGTLLIEAKIAPADIGFIHKDQKAMIKFTSYDFTVFGGLEALVESISVDTIEDKKGEIFYTVKLRTIESELKYKGEPLPIIPGMQASVDIITGQRTVLSYLLKPILKAKEDALRER